MRGKFITLEGVDGAGKSTHLRWLEEFMQGQGIAVRSTREPGGTVVGEELRKLLLDRNQRLSAETETLLVFAARREHIAQVIAPALESGKWVLCDRFTDATYAYQSGGSGVAWERVAALERWVQGELQPDLTLLFDVSTEVGRQRSQRGVAADRFEREEEAYFRRVREAYLRRAQENPGRIRVIDANVNLATVHKELEEVISIYCSVKD